MIIENRAEEAIICGMNDIKPGEIFEHHGTVYMRIKDLFVPHDAEQKRVLGGDGTTYNCANMETGEIYYIHTVSENKVYPCYSAILKLREG
jgi:hypothetical protein